MHHLEKNTKFALIAMGLREPFESVLLAFIMVSKYYLNDNTTTLEYNPNTLRGSASLIKDNLLNN